MMWIWVLPLLFGCSSQDKKWSEEVLDAKEVTELPSVDIDFVDAQQDMIGEEVSEMGLPKKLPFEVIRPDKGDPISTQEIDLFTKKIVNFLKKVEFFDWVLRTSHGVDKSSGMPDFMVWWTGVEAIKKGDLVTFRHTEWGGPDNIMIPTAQVLAQASAAYLLTGDKSAGKVVEQYAKGISGTMMGMVWDENDPVRTIMARAVITHNYEIVMDGGRKKAIDYSAWKHYTEAWNTCTIRVEHNPFWGDIWVKNMRSKDDVPHIFRAVPILRYVAEYGADKEVRDSAKKAVNDLEGFAKDIVDSGYKIRTKDKDGKIFIPNQDLASFVDYEFLDPKAECTSKLSSALIGYGKPLGNDCGKVIPNLYEEFAQVGHYYNVAIFRNFHLSAIMNAYIAHEYDLAKVMLEGLVERIDRDFDLPLEQIPPKAKPEEWQADLAVFLVQSAVVGVPLTSREVRFIHEWYSKAIEEFEKWGYWDLWDPKIPDGTYSYRPNHWIDIERIAYFYEVCWSPFRNPTTKMPVDCDLIKGIK